MIIFENVSAPENGVKLVEDQVQAYFGDQSLGNGTLTVAESSVTWQASGQQAGDTGVKKGFSLTYPSMVLHAISTDLSNFPEEHIFILVDARKSDLQLETNEMDDDEDQESSPSIELRFVPDDKSRISSIYHELCVCQELNPDENDSFSEDEGDMEMDPVQFQMNGAGDGQWFTADNINEVELSEEGQANLRRMMGGHQNGGHNEDEELEE